MGALFDNVAVFHDEDEVGVANSGKAVSNDEASAIFGEFVECGLD